MRHTTAILLAAGKGTRMKSRRAKVLHKIAGAPMVDHVVASAITAGINSIIVVIGYQAQDVQRCLSHYPAVRFAVQKEQRGTGHAAMSAIHLLPDISENVVVLCGDTPLLKPATLSALIEKHHSEGSSATILIARAADSSGYGRAIIDRANKVARIVEEPDATSEEKKINMINTGIYCVKTKILQELLGNLNTENAQKEFYLTDFVQMLYKTGQPASASEIRDVEEILGVNTRVDLARAESVVRKRIAEHWMLEGVTILSPNSVFIDKTVLLGRDTIVYPNNYLLGHTTIGENCVIEPNCFIVDSTIADGVIIKASSVIEKSAVAKKVHIGPFAHVHPEGDKR